MPEPTIQDIIKTLTEEILEINHKKDEMHLKIKQLKEERDRLKEELNRNENEIYDAMTQYIEMQQVIKEKLKDLEEAEKALNKMSPKVAT